MGFFKIVFGNAVEEVKKNLEDSKNEMLKNLNEERDEALGELGFNSSKTSETSRPISDDEESYGSLGELENGVLAIAEGVETLDDESLENYKLLKKIVFPASLKKLDSDVIYEQKQLEEIDFSKVTKLKEIPDDFICGDTLIKTFVIPQGVTKVGDDFLGECGDGTKVFVPESVKELGSINGNGDNNLEVYLFASHIDISNFEEDVKTLYVLDEFYDDYANQLKDVDSEARICKMPKDMLHIYDITSDYNSSDSELSSISNNSSNFGKSIGKKDFPNIKSLKSIIIPDGVSSIKDNAFEDCFDLVSVTLPEGVTSIGESAFEGCLDLESINIPDSVSSIGSHAFSGCSKLKSLTIPKGVRTIEDHTFYLCFGLEEISIPESVITIEASAFNGCHSLKSINIPESVQFIGRNAFQHCKSLTSITIPSNIKKIETSTFMQCKKLRSVTILDGVETIGNDAFTSCESLTYVSVPKSIKKIHSDAFRNCKNLKKKPKTGWF